ncbi:MAG: TRAP transporter substrate-binding protein DctP [Chloroflexota bacterium]|nr:TRAP transporter substrate-binding protein DctP [Chloroflexota bacterium]
MDSTKRQGRGSMLRSVVGVAVVVTGCSAGSDGTGQPLGTGEPPGTGEQVVLRMANSYGDLADLPAVTYFVDRVEELSGGDIVMMVAHSYGDFAPDVEERVVRHVATGDMDLGWVGSRVFDTIGVKSLQALTAPMLVDSYALQYAIIESGMTDEMLLSLDDVGVVGLSVLADGLRKPIGVNGSLVSRADWEGIGFGTYTSEVQEQTIRALGATPARVFGPRREAALLEDTIGGFEMGLRIYQDPKWVKLAPYVTVNVNLWPQMDVLIASPDRIETLTDEQRGWLQEAAADAASRSGALADTETAAVEVACESGARFAEASDANVAALRDMLAPVYAELESDPHTKMFIEQIQALKESTPAEGQPVIPAGCTGEATHPANGGLAADPLEGEWLQESTCADALEAVRRGVEPDVLEASDWSCESPGTQARIARFADGRMVVLDLPEHEVGLSASYELLDGQTFALSDGGENIPETYRFEYRIEDDRLIVDVLEQDPYFVGAWEAAPFVRAD